MKKLWKRLCRQYLAELVEAWFTTEGGSLKARLTKAGFSLQEAEIALDQVQAWARERAAKV